MKRVSTILCLALLGLSANAAEVLEDWPQFLGPRGDNTSLETGLIDKFPPEGPPVVWQKAAGTGYAAPSLRDGKLILHHRVQNDSVISCLDAATGEPIWNETYPTDYVDPYGFNNGPRCAPLLTEDHVYTFGAEGVLQCRHLRSGRLLWTRDTAKEWNVPQAFFGVGSVPILEDGKLIVMLGAQPNAGVVALDPKDGKTLWESVGRDTWDGVAQIGYPGEAPIRWDESQMMASYASPVAATIHGKRHVFCFLRQGLVSVDPADGTVNFKRFFRARVNESVNATNPVVVDDLVFITAAYYGVGSVVLRVGEDGKSYEEVWSSYARAKQAERFSSFDPVLGIHWMTPVYHEGHLYAFSGRNEPDASLRCVELETGKLKWERDESWRKYSTRTPDVYGRGSLIKADGKLIALGEGGLLGMFELNPGKVVETARWQIPGVHYPAWAGPILSHKKLYVRSERALVCLDFAKPAE